MDYLYRFRRMESFLGRRELQTQEIFFASPEILNDPMEGFKDMFWDGDEIVWRNLIQHFALCATQTIGSIAIFQGDEARLQSVFRNVAFFNTVSLGTDREREVHRRICDLLFADDAIAQLPRLLANCNPPVRRDELTFYIRALHPFVIGTIFQVLAEYGPPPTGLPPRNPEAEKQMLRHIGDLLRERNKVRNMRTFLAAKHVFAQTELRRWIEQPGPSANILAKFFVELPDIYVKSLDAIIFSEWAAACFVQKHNDAAMWGNYGDGHKGVCLRFKLAPNSVGKPSLKLNRVVGARGDQKGTELVYGDSDFQFYKVIYSSKPPKVDFFRSIGRLPMPALNRDWLYDAKGKASICVDAMFSKQDVWRKEYWERFQTSITTKLADWQHEDEYRLLLYSVLGRYEGPSALKYSFESLAGLIFGINTSMDDKIAVIKILTEKCKAVGRTDFQLEQAYYSPDSGKIETLPITFM